MEGRIAVQGLVVGAVVAVVGGFAAVSGAAAQATPVNLGPVVNSSQRDAEPTFTADGNTMYFNCFGRPGRRGNDICVTHRVNGDWSEPTVVESVSTQDYTEVEPLLSPDGTRLYIMSDRPGGLGSADIWVSEWVDGDWSEPVNLGAPINSPYMDHCLYFTGPDWDQAFWTSTRPGGYGGNDIWTAERVDGVWQPAENLGPNVNTQASEHHSLPTPDGRSLYVTAVRPDGLGGEDIYVTTRGADGVWGPLVNLGPVVNSPANDRCPAFSPDGRTFYFDSEREGGQGDKDLWSVPYEVVAGRR